MTVRAQRIVRAMGGDWHGSYGNVPAPGHSPRDRSVTIRPHRSNPYDVVVNSFAGDDPLAIKDELRRQGYLPERTGRPGRRRPAGPAQEAAGAAFEKGDVERQLRKALWLWRGSQPIAGTLAERYLREVRGIDGELPPTLRFLPAHGDNPPSMVAGFGLADEPDPGHMRVEASALRGIHLTRLRPDGLGNAGKIMLGRGHTLPIVLAPVNDGLGLAVTEGIEDALTVHMATGLGAWAAGSAGRLPALAGHVPAYVECVTVLIDADPAGERFGSLLTERLIARGFDVRARRMAETGHGR